MLILKSGTAAMLLLLTLQLQACGRKGPLFMPQAPAKPAPEVQAQPSQTQPVPTSTVPGQITPQK
jgi:predicted small lipoprotein YifL